MSVSNVNDNMNMANSYIALWISPGITKNCVFPLHVISLSVAVLFVLRVDIRFRYRIRYRFTLKKTWRICSEGEQWQIRIAIFMQSEKCQLNIRINIDIVDVAVCIVSVGHES